MVKSLVTIRKMIKVPKNREIKIRVPEGIPVNSSIVVEVSIRSKNDDLERKLQLIKESVDDKLFLEDVQVITKDFKNVDSENW
jgi:hypothetical protein